jgi:DNA mismatch endonuclease (patch repair protein)
MDASRRSTDRGYPHPTSAAAAAALRGSRKRDTKPELAIRALLHKRGMRFRVDFALSVGELRVQPDIVFPRARVAIFVDGCFWHKCPLHGNTPRRNTHYWGPKLARNVMRDRAVDNELSEAGWRVLRFWEHVPAEDVTDAVAEAITAYPVPSG